MTTESALESKRIVIHDIKPLPKGRPRFGKNGHVYTPVSTRSYEEALGWFMLSVFKEPWSGPLMVDIQFTTKSRADIDNLVKAILDAGNRVIWNDDSQVRRLTSEMVKGDREKIEITVTRRGR